MNDKFLKEKYGLKETIIEAFITIAASERDLNWWTDREKEIKKWANIIEKSTEIDKNFIVFIIGTYGRGKTLSLLKVTDESKKFSKEIFPIYLNFKGEEKSKPGLDFMFRIFRSIDFDKLAENKTDDEIRKAIDVVPFEEIKNILKCIYYDRLNKQQTLIKITSSNKNTKSEISRLALYHLRGEIKPTSSQLKRLGIIRKIENIDMAKEYLAGILYFMKNLGYKTLLLSIDEFEYLFSLVSKNQYSIYLALLRGLYDFPSGLDIEPDKIANIAFFIAISEDGWNKLKEIEQKEFSKGGPTRPLMRRVDLETTLRNFDRKETEELITKVLRYNRVIGNFKNDPLIPFTKDFVDYIYEITEGLPSKIKKICAHVLDAGLAERVPKLTKEYTRKVLEEGRP